MPSLENDYSALQRKAAFDGDQAATRRFCRPKCAGVEFSELR